MKKKIFLMILMSVSLTAVGCNSQDEAKNVVEEVATEEVKESIQVYGEVRASEMQQIDIDFPSYIESVDVKAGDLIQKGDKLLSFNYSNYKLDMAEKEKNIELLQLEIQQKKATLDPNTLKVESIREKIEKEKSVLNGNNDTKVAVRQEKIDVLMEKIEEANKSLKVDEELLEVGGKSEADITKSKQDIKALEIEKTQLTKEIEDIQTERRDTINELEDEVEALELTLNNTQREIRAEILELEMKVNTEEAELQKMKAKLLKDYISEENIISTMNQGVVYEVSTNPGEIFAEGQVKKVLSIIDQDNIIISVNVPEAFINKVNIGGEAEVTLYTDNNEKVHRGKVINISNIARSINGEVMNLVDIKIEEDNVELKVGNEVEAKLYY